MKLGKVRLTGGAGLSTPAERNALARKIKEKTRAWAKKTCRKRVC